MMINVRLIAATWVISLVVCAMTIRSMSWLFWISASVLVVCTALMQGRKRIFESELDDWLGSDEDFE